MEYKFNGPDGIEKKWQDYWRAHNVYRVSNESAKPKYYVLDMFPYPSGAGLHVGHPLGYIASDIYSRYKRLKGFNVLHPMGYDSFGLPAEQYALETGQHPAVTTEKNIATFRSQLDKIGFSYDWDREVRTSDPGYYRWTQWIFLQIFDSWYNRIANRAERIAGLLKIFEAEGNINHASPGDKEIKFSAEEWNAFDEKRKQGILMGYRLTFSAYGEVNWCEALGTVLANDEVVNGVSERGGHPVEKKKMRQWYLRITEYADRLLEGLEQVDFSDAMKEMQKNWIGKSQGAEMDFAIKGHATPLRVYTTRPDTIFGVDFMVMAPEHELVSLITSGDQKVEIEKYLTYVKNRSERERLAEVKQITGCFTGAYAINPFDGREIPIWIAEYVLAGYGTGAIMAVPCGDQRDFAFAKHYNIPITNIIGEYYNGEEANATKEAILQNSGFLNGLLMKDAIGVAVNKMEELGIGKRKVNYRMRDAGFSRQRYWGEPFPIIWSDGIAVPLDADELPLELPHVDTYGPGPEGEGPLANIGGWVNLGSNLTPSLPMHRDRLSPKERGAGDHGDGEPTSFLESGTLADLTPNPSPKERGTGDHGGEGPASLGSSASYKKGDPGYFNSTADEWRNTLVFAKENRKNFTEAEGIIWEQVRNRQIDGFKFRRQHPIAGYIPDFVCLDKKLIVEIDGEYHDGIEQKKFDEARQNWLAENGFEMLRFTNEEVKNNLKDVLKIIAQRLKQEENKDAKNAPNTPNTPNTSNTKEATDTENEKSQASAGSGSPLLWREPVPMHREVGGEVAGGEVRRETSTMPGYAGSSWYFLRYMDPKNNQTFCDRKASDYWNQVDIYIGGTEHAVGHLLYSRLWTKILFDLGYIGHDEPFKKLVNQGMITGVSEKIFGEIFNDGENKGALSNYVKYLSEDGIIIKEQLTDGAYRRIFYSTDLVEKLIFKIHDLNEKIEFSEQNVNIQWVNNNVLDIKKINSTDYLKGVVFVSGSGYYINEDKLKFKPFVNSYVGASDQFYTKSVVEKMSKSKLNVENPNDIIEKFGADTFRMYEMFLGPVEQSKPWDTKGIEGVHRFLRKLWRLFFDDVKGRVWTSTVPSLSERAEGEVTDAELKALHKAIKKIEEDTERFSFNTAVSAFMICVNELADLKCHKKEVLEKVLILLTPYAPHIAEELWNQLGNEGTILDATYPTFDAKYLVESFKEYPISINGKVRANINLALNLEQAAVEEIVLQNEIVQKWLDGKKPKRIVYVKNKMVNVVI